MAPMLGGRIDMRYRRVECTPPTNLVVNIEKNSGTGGFLKMSVTVCVALVLHFLMAEGRLVMWASIRRSGVQRFTGEDVMKS